MIFMRFIMAIAVLAFSAGIKAAENGPAPIPVAVAESESFEAVGRLTVEGMSWFIDRADTNAPVLNAELELESGGKAVKAQFRPERGDYLVADEKWLQPLRQPGDHPLVLTLLAGSDSDLLSGGLHVDTPVDAVPGALALPAGAGLVAVLLGIGGLVVWRMRRRAKGGA